MIERTTSYDVVITAVSWTGVAGLYIVAGMLLLNGLPHAGLFVAEVACGASAFAAVRHIRCYAVRVCELVRHVDDNVRNSRAVEVPLQRVH